MNEQVTAGNAVKQAKHSELLGLLHQVQDVINHLEELNKKLGVYRIAPIPAAVAPAAPFPEEPKKPEPNTLVALLDLLPESINHKVNKLHGMLSDLENSLL